jgi:hypothetical protein
MESQTLSTDSTWLYRNRSGSSLSETVLSYAELRFLEALNQAFKRGIDELRTAQGWVRRTPHDLIYRDFRSAMDKEMHRCVGLVGRAKKTLTSNVTEAYDMLQEAEHCLHDVSRTLISAASAATSTQDAVSFTTAERIVSINGHAEVGRLRSWLADWARIRQSS